jgi:iron complex outermembrane receptor protein
MHHPAPPRRSAADRPLHEPRRDLAARHAQARQRRLPRGRAKKAEKGIETVVVTAQKRSQSIKEVPLAITVVNAAQLERAGVKDIGDLAKTAAALEFGDQNSTSGQAAAPRSAASAPP